VSLDGFVAGPDQSEENPLGSAHGAAPVGLHARGLVDEFELHVVPILLGDGDPALNLALDDLRPLLEAYQSHRYS
jgi:hypothetical protein